MIASAARWFTSLSLLGMVIQAGPANAQEERPVQVPPNVEVKKDLVYGKGGTRDLELDLYLPRGNEKARPAIVFIHGGGWKSGNRTTFARPAAYLAGKGYVGACISYRLSTEATFPAAVEDCKGAVRWLRANAKTYRIDPERIAACGPSAGGHLAAMLGVTSKEKELEGKGGNPECSSRVNLVIDLCGVSDFPALVKNPQTKDAMAKFLGASFSDRPDLYQKASPITYVDKDAPPFLFAHGTADTLVPIDQARTMVKKLKDAGVDADLFEAKDGDHGFFTRSPHNQALLKRIEEFLQDHFQKKALDKK